MNQFENYNLSKPVKNLSKVDQRIVQIQDYQRNAYLKAKYRKVFAYFAKVGVGKTKMAFDLVKYFYMNRKIKRVLWITIKSLIEQTKKELEKWYPELIEIFEFINIEKISRKDPKKIKEFINEFKIDHETYLICDETLKIKNIEAKRTQFLLLLSDFALYKLILNGTPLSKNYGDLFAQFSFLDKRILKYRDYHDFVKKHFEFYKNQPWKIIKTHNLDFLKEQIKDFIYDIELENSYKVIEEIPSYGEQNEDLAILEKLWCDEIKNFQIRDVNQNLLLIYTKMNILSELEDHKLETLETFLNQEKNQSEHFIIFCRYLKNVEKIKDLLGERAIVYTGKHKDDLDLFKNGMKQFLIMSFGTGTFGHNGFQNHCSRMIFYDHEISPDENIQATGRIDRAGQNEECQFWKITNKKCLIYRLVTKRNQYKNNSLVSFINLINEIVNDQHLLEEIRKEVLHNK